MTYNPLIDAEVTDFPQLYGLLDAAPDSWLTLRDQLHEKIIRAAKRGEGHEVLRLLNVMDLLDDENAEWWRDMGLEFYGGRVYVHERPNKSGVLQGGATILSLI
jgi:hypothetical protein